MTCPNRDGKLGNRGCIFCSAGGSGDFAVEVGTAGQHSISHDISLELEEGIRLIEHKLNTTTSFENKPNIIAYFQAYTNTYAPVAYLREVFTAALSNEKVCGISIATRPDCLEDDVLNLLCALKEQFPEKFIWIELGLQTIHDKTAHYIRRGYALPCFEDAMKKLQAIHIPVIVHVILGLPGETSKMMLETIHYLNRWMPFGVKLQLLHVLEHTDLAIDFADGKFNTLTKTEYLDILIQCLEHLSSDIVIHRVTGDGPKKILISPTWSADKKGVLNSLHKLMKEQNARQGRKYT